ncbi:hypothetical protein Hdeb2414_s0003g00082931 [Helianthus debilis subsp. tardiflorus]
MKFVTQVFDGIFVLGYDGATNDYSRFLNLDGVDMSQGVYGENGSVMYPVMVMHRMAHILLMVHPFQLRVMMVNSLELNNTNT